MNFLGGKQSILALIRSALSPRRTGLDQLIKIGHDIAVARFHHLISSGKLRIHNLDISIESAALTSIMDIFLPQKNGELSILKRHFSDEFDPYIIDEEDAQQRFRTLIFLKLNDGIAHLLGESDPIYTKILKNLRHHISRDPYIKKFKMWDETYIYSCPEDKTADDKLEFPLEQLEAILCSRLKGNENIKDFLYLLLEILNEQEEYQKFLSLSDITKIIKRIIGRQIQYTYSKDYSQDEDIDEEDLTITIKKYISDTKKILQSKFSKEKTIDKILFDKFFLACSDILFEYFISDENVKKTHFDYVKKYLPEIDKEEYENKYKNSFEYMIKIAKNHVIEKFKETL